jgi:DNA repair protein RadC
MPIFDELDDSSRPREHLREAGSILELRDDELLGLLIRIGRQGKNAVEVGRELKEAFGSVRNMVYADWRQIRNKRISGVGEVKAMELAAAFELARRGAKLSAEDFAKPVETPRDVFEHVRALGVSDVQEHFFALYLDPKKRLLCPPKVITTGLVNYSVLHARELFREAIQWGATTLYVAHNHPSGDATPSDEDIELTKSLYGAAELIGIPLRDHVVVGTENSPGPAWASIRERMFE